MKKLLIALLLLTFIGGCSQSTKDDQPNKNKSTDPGPITLVIHGGAGTILKKNMTPEREEAYQNKLKEALDAGYAVLEKGGTSLDAVTTAIQIMEESPLFNAGRGAVFTNDGKNELDAAIMDGATRNAGTVAGISHVKSPILAARAVMEKSPHVMMIGKGAEQFAQEQGLEIVDPSYFFDQRRYDNLLRVKAREEQKETSYILDPLTAEAWQNRKYGTVGAVALDQYGNLAAGTSTGGMTNKKYGRVGDVPIIGAGTYADNSTCAVSATGHGEYFIRSVVGYDISALMKYKQMDVKAAGEEVVMNKLVGFGGSGGVIILDRQGNFSMPFNSAGMYRGYINKKGEAKAFIYR